MSVTPNFCCDETKNRGAYTRVTVARQVLVVGGGPPVVALMCVCMSGPQSGSMEPRGIS